MSCMPPNEKKNCSEEIGASATKLERSSTAGGSWGQVQSNEKIEAKQNRQ